MKELIIAVPVEDDDVAFFIERDMIVTPVSDFEAGQFAIALQAIADTQALNNRALRTLAEVAETKGATSADLMKTLTMLFEPNRIALEQIDYIRTLLGRSARVGRISGQSGKKGRMQCPATGKTTALKMRVRAGRFMFPAKLRQKSRPTARRRLRKTRQYHRARSS